MNENEITRRGKGVVLAHTLYKLHARPGLWEGVVSI